MAVTISNANEPSTLSTGPSQAAGQAPNLITATGFDKLEINTTDKIITIKNGNTTIGSFTYS